MLSGVAGPVSAPVVSSRPWAERVKASLCPRKGRGEEGALCAPASSRGPEVQGPSCAKAARAPLSSSARPSEEPCLHSNSPQPCHGDRSQSLELVSRTFTHKHSCSVQGTLSEPRRRLVASSSHSQPRRAEVSGNEVKVNPGIAGKATRRARPTDPESAGCTRLRLSREHRLSGLAGVGPKDRAGQGLTH